jgi:hypothetical protein
MTDVDDVLAHFGVMGMKWGHRKSAERVAKQTARTNRKLVRKSERQDERWRASSNDTARAFWVYHAAKKDMKKNGIPALNNSKKYKGKDLKANPALRRQYMKDFTDAFTKSMNEQSLKQIGTNSAGTKKVTFTYDMSNPNVPTGKIVTIGGGKGKVKHDDLGHADLVVPPLPAEIPVTFTFGPNGEILDVIFDDPVEHSDLAYDGRIATQDALVAIGLEKVAA